MLYPAKGFGVINETHVHICFSIALSDIILTINITFLVPVSSTKPHCSIPISVLILLHTLSMMILRMSFIMWLIRLMVLWSSHSTAPGSLGRAMKIDLQRFHGISPAPWISLMIYVTLLTLYSSKDLIISVTILSGPAALYLFIFFNAAWTSDLRIFGSSMFLELVVYLPCQHEIVPEYIQSISPESCFSTIIVPSLDFILPEDE